MSRYGSSSRNFDQRDDYFSRGSQRHDASDDYEVESPGGTRSNGRDTQAIERRTQRSERDSRSGRNNDDRSSVSRGHHASHEVSEYEPRSRRRPSPLRTSAQNSTIGATNVPIMEPVAEENVATGPDPPLSRTWVRNSMLRSMSIPDMDVNQRVIVRSSEELERIVRANFLPTTTLIMSLANVAVRAEC